MSWRGFGVGLAAAAWVLAGAGQRKRLAEVEKQLDGLITAISQGLRSSSLQARLDALETEEAKIERSLAQPAPSPVRLHPNLAELYRQEASGAARGSPSRGEPG